MDAPILQLPGAVGSPDAETVPAGAGAPLRAPGPSGVRAEGPGWAGRARGVVVDLALAGGAAAGGRPGPPRHCDGSGRQSTALFGDVDARLGLDGRLLGPAPAHP